MKRFTNFCLLLIPTLGLFVNQSLLANESTLPLSSKEINKLQHLFPNSGADQVPSFQLSTPHEHIIWQQAPIDVTLPVGHERMVSFPSNVGFGYDKSVLPDNVLRIQNNNGTLYLLANNEFATQRVQVRCTDTGQIILLNLSGQKNASTTPLDIVVAQKPTLNQTSVGNISAPTANDNSISTMQTSPVASSFSDDAMSYITLTRFAAQQLYAPKRLLVQPSNIFRTPMHVNKTIPLFRDGSVIAMPLASWRGGDLTVTAVLLRNQQHQSLTLDPRNICGDWRATSFYPQTILAPVGQSQDSTTVFLVANRAFADALHVCTRGF